MRNRTPRCASCAYFDGEPGRPGTCHYFGMLARDDDACDMHTKLPGPITAAMVVGISGLIIGLCLMFLAAIKIWELME